VEQEKMEKNKDENWVVALYERNKIMKGHTCLGNEEKIVKEI